MYFKPYRYVKAPPKKRKKPRRITLLFDEFFPLGFIFLGSFILATQIVIPLISFPSEKPLLRPVERVLAREKVLGEVAEILEERKDVPPVFFLSIPKLGIEKAKVKTDTKDPDPKDFLGHLLGSALPGEPGAIFIYGHSTFPWLFDPEDYLTIFSTLPKLEKGDKIFLSYSDSSWEYEVNGFKTLDLSELSFDSFSVDEPRLVLMTCVPPGTRLKRFLVLASLSPAIPLEL